jgi:hypothetical protein
VQFNLLDPTLDILEGLSVCNRIGEQYSHGSSIVGLSDSFELLLTGCVPYLQPYFVFSYRDRLRFKIDADSGEVRDHEVSLAVLKQNIGLPHSTISDDEQFD